MAGHEILNDHQRRLEQMYLGLRTRRGIALPDPCPPKLLATLERWTSAGWAVVEAARARLTPQGWLRLDELVASI